MHNLLWALQRLDHKEQRIPVSLHALPLSWWRDALFSNWRVAACCERVGAI